MRETGIGVGVGVKTMRGVFGDSVQEIIEEGLVDEGERDGELAVDRDPEGSGIRRGGGQALGCADGVDSEAITWCG
jgi:hypothetical protein